MVMDGVIVRCNRCRTTRDVESLNEMGLPVGWSLTAPDGATLCPQCNGLGGGEVAPDPVRDALRNALSSLDSLVIAELSTDARVPPPSPALSGAKKQSASAGGAGKYVRVEKLAKLAAGISRLYATSVAEHALLGEEEDGEADAYGLYGRRGRLIGGGGMDHNDLMREVLMTAQQQQNAARPLAPAAELSHLLDARDRMQAAGETTDALTARIHALQRGFADVSKEEKEPATDDSPPLPV